MTWNDPNLDTLIAEIAEADTRRNGLAMQEYDLQQNLIPDIDAIEKRLFGFPLADISAAGWPPALNTGLEYVKDPGNEGCDGYRKADDITLQRVASMTYNPDNLDIHDAGYARLPSLQINIWDNTLDIFARFGTDNEEMEMRRAERIFTFHNALCLSVLDRLQDPALKQRVMADRTEQIAMIQHLVTDDRLYMPEEDANDAFTLIDEKYSGLKRYDFNALVAHTRHLTLEKANSIAPDGEQYNQARRVIFGWLAACDPAVSDAALQCFRNTEMIGNINEDIGFLSDNRNVEDPFYDLGLPKPVMHGTPLPA